MNSLPFTAETLISAVAAELAARGGPRASTSRKAIRVTNGVNAITCSVCASTALALDSADLGLCGKCAKALAIVLKLAEDDPDYRHLPIRSTRIAITKGSSR